MVQQGRKTSRVRAIFPRNPSAGGFKNLLEFFTPEPITGLECCQGHLNSLPFPRAFRCGGAWRDIRHRGRPGSLGPGVRHRIRSAGCGEHARRSSRSRHTGDGRSVAAGAGTSSRRRRTTSCSGCGWSVAVRVLWTRQRDFPGRACSRQPSLTHKRLGIRGSSARSRGVGPRR